MLNRVPLPEEGGGIAINFPNKAGKRCLAANRVPLPEEGGGIAINSLSITGGVLFPVEEMSRESRRLLVKRVVL